MKKLAKNLIPPPLVPIARRLYYLPIDSFDRLTGKRDAMTPPRRLWFVGGGDFKRSGERFRSFFVNLGGLKPEDRVLDVGCGVGRMAVPLTAYLNDKGRYEGFDTVEEGITWCRKAISSRYPNFRFQTVSLYNKTYNPKGRYKASEFRFPYEDASFDFVFLTSVFTHLLPEDMAHYVSEISRVLSPEGRCFATFFLLNPDSVRSIAAGESTLAFRYALPGCKVDNDAVPEDAVAYEEGEVRELLSGQGLSVREPIHYGKWSGRKEFTSYQDIVVALKG